MENLDPIDFFYLPNGDDPYPHATYYHTTNEYLKCGYPMRKKNGEIIVCVRQIGSGTGCPLHRGKRMRLRCEHGTCTNLTSVVRYGTPTCYKHGNADRIKKWRERRTELSDSTSP